MEVQCTQSIDLTVGLLDTLACVVHSNLSFYPQVRSFSSPISYSDIAETLYDDVSEFLDSPDWYSSRGSLRLFLDDSNFKESHIDEVISFMGLRDVVRVALFRLWQVSLVLPISV